MPNNVVEKNASGNAIRTWFETTPPGPQTESSTSDLIEKYKEHLGAGMHKIIVIA